MIEKRTGECETSTAYSLAIGMVTSILSMLDLLAVFFLEIVGSHGVAVSTTRCESSVWHQR